MPKFTQTNKSSNQKKSRYNMPSKIRTANSPLGNTRLQSSTGLDTSAGFDRTEDQLLRRTPLEVSSTGRINLPNGMLHLPSRKRGRASGGGTLPWSCRFVIERNANDTPTSAKVLVTQGKLYKDFPGLPSNVTLIGEGAGAGAPAVQPVDGVFQLTFLEPTSTYMVFLELWQVQETEALTYKVNTALYANFEPAADTETVDGVDYNVLKYPIGYYSPSISSPSVSLARNNYYVTTVCANGQPFPSLTVI